ncbi:hypothetical protein [Agrobacterium salinitolerans]|uniref:hypothetical protein n=1 Tax=Agrobacterium salinitolerans TaxID=1183413 RepID=UPI001FCF2076|nr:hypothetical protein [Agrobacterium salinitolerans]
MLKNLNGIAGAPPGKGAVTMISRITRQKDAKQRLSMALRQLNDAVRDLHKSGLDVEIMELTMLTSRGDMKQFDIRTFRAEGAPPDLKVVGD